MCGAARDKEAVESALCCALGTLCDAAALQDLRCVRCGTVATEHLQGACDACGGRLACTRPPEGMLLQLRVYRSVVRYHGMPVLQELVQSALAQQPEVKPSVARLFA